MLTQEQGNGVTTQMLKNTAHAISYPLKTIFNLSLFTSIFPSSWKHSNVTPIPKISSPSSSPSAYRPISLLSKLLEKHIYRILADFSADHSLISKNQYGFLPPRSIISALLFATHSILAIFDSHSSACGVFLDLNKALDSVPH